MKSSGNPARGWWISCSMAAANSCRLST
jgi:hypothetical protein